MQMLLPVQKISQDTNVMIDYDEYMDFLSGCSSGFHC